MIFYIDFDNTLYETARLTPTMLSRIASSISEKISVDKNSVYEDAKNSFNSSVDNIYEHAKKMAIKYNIDSDYVVNEVRDVVNHGEQFIFEDARRFLQKLKDANHKVILLTYISKGNQEYQLQKVNGSGIANMFDAMIITTEPKNTLDLNYENGIFIDDNPRDLEGLNSMNPLRLIRIRKPNTKRSNIDMDIENMEEYVTFDDISIDFN